MVCLQYTLNCLQKSEGDQVDPIKEEFSISVSSAKSDSTLKTDTNEHKNEHTFLLSSSIDGAPQDVNKESSRSSSTTSSSGKNSSTPSRQIGESGHQMSVLFRQELLNVCQAKADSRIGVEVTKLSDPDLDVVQLLGRCLPHIVPNVNLAKREVRWSRLQ